MEIEHLIVTTDFSNLARGAYPVAVAMARRHAARISLVHVAESLPPFCYLHAEAVATRIPTEPHHERLGQRLEEEISAHPGFRGIDVRPRLLHHESPHEAVVAEAVETGADTILVSTHGHTGLAHVLLGSVAERIVRASPVPVLTCRVRRGRSTPSIEPPSLVLVPFDFSENARAVFPVVRFLSDRYGARFVFLYALDASGPWKDHLPSEAVYESLMDLAREAPRRARREFARLHEQELGGVALEFEVHDGAPEREIVRRAEELGVDLIAMATHGWTGLRHLMLGSVTEKTVRRAPCSVLTVRPDG